MPALTHIKLISVAAEGTGPVVEDWSVINRESGFTLTAADAPTGSAGVDTVVPWCSDQASFNIRHIEVYVRAGFSERRFYLWQNRERDRDRIRFSVDGVYHGINSPFAEPGEAVPGEPTPGPDKVLTLFPGRFALLSTGA